MMKKLILPAAIAAGFLSPTPLLAQPRWFEAGMLYCTGKGGLGYILASQKEVLCRFTPSGRNRPAEAYLGTMSKYGVDVGATGRTVMAWYVMASTRSPLPIGTLAGNYGGVSAEATAVIGAGTSVLFGGTSQTIMLQPVSVQGQSGVNVAVAVSGFQMRWAG